MNVWSDIYDDTNRIHAIAVLGKQDLVDFYLSRIDATLADAVKAEDEVKK